MPPHARAAIDAPADQYRSGPAKLGRHGSEPRKTRGYRRSESARSKLWAEHQPDQSREDTHIQGDSTSSGAHRLHPLPSASVIAALEGAEAKSHTTTIWTGSPAPLRRRRSPRHAESQKVRSPQGPSHFAWVPRCSGMSLEAAPGAWEPPGAAEEATSVTRGGCFVAAASRERATRAGHRPLRRHSAPVPARGQARGAVASAAAPERNEARPARTR
jgi:hypothetical protein